MNINKNVAVLNQSSQALPQKRGRGRPKGSKNKPKNVEQHNIFNEVSGSINTAPQKNVITALTPTQPVKRGRGRPKGSKNKPKNEVLGSINTEISKNITVASTSTQPVKRGRGRPKGSKNNSKNTELTSIIQSTPPIIAIRQQEKKVIEQSSPIKVKVVKIFSEQDEIIKFCFNAGRYFIGDIGHALRKDIYEIWDKQYKHQDGIFSVNNKNFIVVSTSCGDGIYVGTDKRKYYVDNGVIGVVPEELCRHEGHNLFLGKMVTVFQNFDFCFKNGIFIFGIDEEDTIKISTVDAAEEDNLINKFKQRPSSKYNYDNERCDVEEEKIIDEYEEFKKEYEEYLNEQEFE